MVSIRFDFPEVSVPPYAPLVVVLVGLVGAGAATMWQALKDRRKFDLSVENWRDRVASYRVLLTYITVGALEQQNNARLTPELQQRVTQRVVTALLSTFPTPAGCYTIDDLDQVLHGIVDDTELRVELCKSLLSQYQHMLGSMPADPVTALCMCLVPQATATVVSTEEVAVMAKKLQHLAKSFDRTIKLTLPSENVSDTDIEAHNSKSNDGADGDLCEALIRGVAEVWSRAPEGSIFAEVLEELCAQECFRGTPIFVERPPTSVKERTENGEIENVQKDDCSQKPNDPSAAEGDRAPMKAAAGWEPHAVMSEGAFLAHINTFVRAVLTWVVTPDDDHLRAFVLPFIQYYAAREQTDSNTVGKKDIKTRDGHLLCSRQAARLYSVLRHHEAAADTDKAPPYNRRVPTRSFRYLDAAAGDATLHTPYQVRLAAMRSTNLAAAVDNNEQPQSKGATIVTSNDPRCCPEHIGHIMVKASEVHMASKTLDGRPMYRCCNVGLDEVKQALHGKQHTKGDECDDGEMYICPERSCGFAVCGRCLKREVPPVGLMRVHAAGVVHTLRHLSPLTVVVLEGLLFPVTQIPLLVLTCSPTLSCWLSNCYSNWSAEFIVSFCLAVILLALRIVAGVWLCVELLRRRHRCEGVICPNSLHDNSDAVLLVRNERWEYFVEQCDRSLLRSMYVSTELSYIAWGPGVKLVFDIVLVLVVCLTPAGLVRSFASLVWSYSKS